MLGRSQKTFKLVFGFAVLGLILCVQTLLPLLVTRHHGDDGLERGFNTA